MHVLLGAGGRGKTRLAVELAARARRQGWTAGFAPRDELDVFRAAGCRTAWDGPTLVVIDYVAAKSAAIAAWLRALAHDSTATREGGPKLRLLLLERLGGEGTPWWREVFGGADDTAEVVREWLAPDGPVTLGPLADPAQQHAVFAAAFHQASSSAAPARNAALDDVLARVSLGGEPLFLAMFGLIAARQGLTAAPALPADRIALDLARQELERIGKIWAAHGQAIGADRRLHEHLAAVATLCEGLPEAEAGKRKSSRLPQLSGPSATPLDARRCRMPSYNRGRGYAPHPARRRILRATPHTLRRRTVRGCPTSPAGCAAAHRPVHGHALLIAPWRHARRGHHQRKS